MKERFAENEPIVLHKATAQDVDDFLVLENSVDGTHTYSAMTNREEALKDFEENTVYLIKKGNAVVGNISYKIESSSHVHISGLVIAPLFQGRGIGKEALETILKEHKNVERVDLVTHPENTRAIALYESLGFKVESQKENYYGDGEPRLVMVLEK